MEFDEEQDEEISALQKELQVVAVYSKIACVPWEKAMEAVGINADAILDEILAPGTSKQGREYAARNLGLLPRNPRKNDDKPHLLRFICCPCPERVELELAMNEFPTGCIDGMIAFDQLATRFQIGRSGSEYYLFSVPNLDETWKAHKKHITPPLVHVCYAMGDWVDNEDFYCQKTDELDKQIAKLMRSTTLDEVRECMEALDEYDSC